MTHHRLDWRDGLFYGDEPLGVADECDAARALLAHNLAVREDTFTTYRGDMPCLTMGVGWGADRRVAVNEAGTPVFRLTDPASRGLRKSETSPL